MGVCDLAKANQLMYSFDTGKLQSSPEVVELSTSKDACFT